MGKNLIRIFPKELEEFDKKNLISRDIFSVYIAIPFVNISSNLVGNMIFSLISDDSIVIHRQTGAMFAVFHTCRPTVERERLLIIRHSKLP